MITVTIIKCNQSLLQTFFTSTCNKMEEKTEETTGKGD